MKRIITVVLAIVAAGLAWYLGSPLFLDERVAETAPVNVAALANGTFTEIDGAHWASGTATILENPDGVRILRFEEGFESSNGPDLRVLLSIHPEPRNSNQLGEYIELADLKGNIGSQNYEIPADVDLAEIQSVVIYCSPFRVVFSTATLVSAVTN